MHAQHHVGIKLFLKMGHGFPMQQRAPFPIEAHIIALGLDAFDIGHGHAQEAAAVADPEFFFIARALALIGFLAQRFQHGGELFGAPSGVLRRAPFSGARERGTQPLELHGLQQIIDGRGFKRLQRIGIERGDENHGGAACVFDCVRHLEPVSQRHLDIEQHDVGTQRLHRVDRLRAIAGGADDLHVGNLLQGQPHAPQRQRFVVSQKQAQGFCGHALPPEATKAPHGNHWARDCSR